MTSFHGVSLLKFTEALCRFVGLSVRHAEGISLLFVRDSLSVELNADKHILLLRRSECGPGVKRPEREADQSLTCDHEV